MGFLMTIGFIYGCGYFMSAFMTYVDGSEDEPATNLDNIFPSKSLIRWLKKEA